MIVAMRRPGQFAPLSVHYYDDDKIMEAGELCEVLFTRMLAYAASQAEHEGWISDRVIQSRLGILPFDAGNDAGIVPGTDAGSRAERLREVGLLQREGAGYRITSWLRWNRSAEEMGKERRRDRGRKTDVTTGADGNGAGNGAGIPDAVPPTSCTERPDQTRPDIYAHHADADALVDVPADKPPLAAAPRATSYPEQFEEFWKIYPAKKGKRKALTAWRAAVKRASNDEIIAGAKRYAADPRRDPEHTKYAEGWLNDDRWLDEPTTAAPAATDEWWEN